MAGASTDLDRRTLYRILLLFRKKILLPEQALALGKLEHAVVAHERNAPKTWQNTVAIAREAKERTKSELSVADILKLYCIVSVSFLSGSSYQLLMRCRSASTLCRSTKRSEIHRSAMP